MMEPQKKKQKIKCIVYTDEELIKKQEAGKNKNTTKTEERANRAFQKFLMQCGESNVEYWLYKEPETDSDDPERKELMYSANTMR